MIMLCLLGAELGNQLFAYSYGRFLAEKHGSDLWVNAWMHDEANPKRYGHKFRLPELQVRYSYCSFDWNDERAMRSAFPHLKYFKQMDTISPADQFAAAGDNLILVGEWANFTSYLTDENGTMLPMLRREFNLKTAQRSAQHVDLRQRIEAGSASVGVHVRLGNNRIHDTGFPVLGADYYERAFSCIEQSVANPHYFVFSDEVDYVEANYRFPQGAPLELVRTASDFEDFDLMKRCKHNIIANSTFSWWAACLNENRGKKVVAPLKYFANPLWQKAYETVSGETAYMPAEWEKV